MGPYLGISLNGAIGTTVAGNSMRDNGLDPLIKCSHG